ncbi:unnamed protein product [Paramecium sonneborni]|uniref:Uncharacterized protein n=1 Tax=Paramecium sonneborni TaxID=65129 RepID=A0A8S1N698_9CILI|nr:unnamed protein product [Paramecium sonneborni]
MQIQKRMILKTDSDFQIIKSQQSHISSSKPIKLPLIQLSPAPQKKNNLSLHKHLNKAPPDEASLQSLQTFRGRSVTLNRKNLSQLIQPIPLQALSKQLFVHQQKFQDSFQKTQQEIQYSRQKQIYTEKNYIDNNQKKIHEALYSFNEHKPQLKVEQSFSKKYNLQQEQSYKKQSFQCYQKIIPKYHTEYTKQLLMQFPKLLEISNHQYQDQQQKCQTDYERVLNMSEIQEMNEDGLSSIAQSTFYNKVC